MLNYNLVTISLTAIFISATTNLTALGKLTSKNVDKQLKYAIKLFRSAKDSDNPKLDYRKSIIALDKILRKTEDKEIIIRCYYFRAFAYFIMRDYVHANHEAVQVIKLSSSIYSGKSQLKYADDIISAVQDGSASLNEALIALVANKQKSAAAFGQYLKKYFDKTKGTFDEKLFDDTATTIITLSVLSPVFCPNGNLAKEKTLQSLCQDNMRFIIKGWLAYIRNHNGKVPPISIKVNTTGSSCHDRAEWPSIIGKYLPDKNLQKSKFNAPASSVRIMPGSIMQCPAAKLWPNGFTSSYGVDYGMNHMADNVKTFKNIKNLHKLIIFIDSRNSYAGPTWGYNYIQFRHSGGANVAYADGHVDWKSRRELINNSKLPIWKPQKSQASRIQLELEDQTIGIPIKIQGITGIIHKPTYVRKGKELFAKVENISAFKGKALVIGDNSKTLSQYVSFTINPVENCKYKVEFDYLPLKTGKSHIVVFDLRNNKNKQIFVMALHNNMTDLSIINNKLARSFKGIIQKDEPTHFKMTVDLKEWAYELNVNKRKVSVGKLITVSKPNFRSIIFWVPECSEFAIKNLTANKIKI